MKNLRNVITSLLIAVFVFGTAVVSAATLPSLPQSSGSFSNTNANSAINFERDTNISKTNPPVTLSLRSSDVKQVLRMFADRAGKNIIFHTSLDAEGNDRKAKNSVTMDLVKVPLNKAFKMVLQVSDLTYFLDGDTIIVITTDAAKTSAIGRQNMSVIPVKYLDASKVANFLNKNVFSSGQPGLSNSNIAVTNTEKNEVILFGTPSDYQIAKRIVTQFDVKPYEETFIVNHTTPKDMSKMICKVLFKDLAKKGEDEGVIFEKDLEDDDDDNDDEDDDDDDDDKTKAVKIGEGKIACQFRSTMVDAEKSNNGSTNSGNKDSLISLESGGLTIVYYADRGTIYARGGTAEQMRQIKDFIAKNDKQQFQAYLEMSIVELNETGSKEFSNTWNVYSSFFTGSFDTSLASAAPTYVKGSSVPDMFQPTIPILAKYTGAPVVTYAINYLIQNGKGKVLANPRILISSGKKAKIDLTSSYIKKVTSQVMDTVASASGAVQKTYDIGNDLGIEIELQPYISPDGYVTMNIISSYSTIKDQVSEPRVLTTNQLLGTTEVVNDLVATLIDKREVNLKNIKIMDGETMVIGGMIKETETKQVYKLPLLGDLPVIGMLFRNTSSQKEKNELVIMLTPRIIKETLNDTIQNKAAL